MPPHSRVATFETLHGDNDSAGVRFVTGPGSGGAFWTAGLTTVVEGSLPACAVLASFMGEGGARRFLNYRESFSSAKLGF